MKKWDLNNDLNQLVEERVTRGLELPDNDYVEKLLRAMSFKPQPVRKDFEEFFRRYGGYLCDSYELRRRIAKAAILACSIKYPENINATETLE